MSNCGKITQHTLKATLTLQIGITGINLGFLTAVLVLPESLNVFLVLEAMQLYFSVI